MARLAGPDQPTRVHVQIFQFVARDDPRRGDCPCANGVNEGHRALAREPLAATSIVYRRMSASEIAFKNVNGLQRGPLAVIGGANIERRLSAVEIPKSAVPDRPTCQPPNPHQK